MELAARLAIAGRRRAELARDRTGTWETPVTIRRAVPDDCPALIRLAQLDSQALPAPPFLVAVREGRIDAAISLTDQRLIADPFRRTAELCELLRCHA